LGHTYLLRASAPAKPIRAHPYRPVNIIIAHCAPPCRLPKGHDAIKRVKPDVLPFQYQAPVHDFKLLFTARSRSGKQSPTCGYLQEIFGATACAVICGFSKSRELGPPGGFMGSFGVLDIKDEKNR